VLRTPLVWGRDYVVGLDRRHFDYALWEHLARYPSITRHEGYAVTDLVRDAEGRVVGIVGAARGEPPREISAGCVVGADGRFSLVARKAGSPVVKEDREHVSTVYYADWEGVAPLGDDDGAYIYTTGRGLDVPMFR